MRWKVLALAVLVCASAPAAAQDPTDPIEARGMELYENGVILYDEGRYEDAIVAWTEGYRLTQRSGFLYNIANAQERIGDYQGAIDTLGRYRALAKAEERETLDRRIRSLEQRMAAAPRPAPAPVPVPVPVPAPVQPVASRSLRPVVGGSMVGVGVAGVGVGTWLGTRARTAKTAAAAQCREVGDGLLCPTGAADAIGANHRNALLADVGFGVGTALGIVGAVVLVGGPDRPVAIGLEPAAGGGGLVVRASR
jgi:tetratricopeptide (TPR) repeat protein